MILWSPVCCFLQDTGFSLGFLLKPQPWETKNCWCNNPRAESSIINRVQSCSPEEGAPFVTGWIMVVQPHLRAVVVQQKEKVGTGSSVCVSPALFCCNTNLVTLRSKHLAKAPLWIYHPEETTNYIPVAQVICTAPTLDFNHGTILKDHIQPKSTHKQPTRSPPACLPSPPEHCSLQWLTPFSSILHLTAFQLQREGRKPYRFTTQLSIMQPHYWRTPTKYTARNKCSFELFL